MKSRNIMPSGQREIDYFPRFGLPQYARRSQKKFAPLQLRISGDIQDEMTINATQLSALPRVEQASDFHCVTTWTKPELRWGGFRFIDFYETIVQPEAQPAPDAAMVIFRSQDGFRAACHCPICYLKTFYWPTLWMEYPYLPNMGSRFD